MPSKKQATMPLENTAPAPDFGALLEATVAQYSDAIEREATQAEHERAELFCEYVDILHAQDAERIDELLDIAHRLGIPAAKAKADFGIIAEANRLQALADTQEQAIADWQAASNELIEWRASFNAESFRRLQACNAAEMVKNNALDAGRNRAALLSSHPELFNHKPTPKPQPTSPDDVPEGFEQVTGSLGGLCLRKLPDSEPAAA